MPATQYTTVVCILLHIYNVQQGNLKLNTYVDYRQLENLLWYCIEQLIEYCNEAKQCSCD